VEIEKLISALEETVSFLWNFRSSAWSHLSVDELIEQLEAELVSIRESGFINKGSLRSLYAPTGTIQDTSMDNGWGDEFLKISEVVDQFTG
jgi:hypothetical protein